MDSTEGNSSYRQILKYTSLFGSIQGINILIALVRNKIVAVLLGPSVMGLMSLFNSTLQMLSTATNLGLGTSGVKSLSEQMGDDSPSPQSATTSSAGSSRESASPPLPDSPLESSPLGEKKPGSPDAGLDGEREVGFTRGLKVIRSWVMLTAVAGFVLSLLLVPLLNRLVFAGGEHCLELFLLVPAVPMMAIFGGELAVLKATRQLASIARISILNMAFTLVAALLLFYFVGAKAIVPYLLSVAFAQMLFTIIHSYRLYPLRLSFGRAVLREGLPVVKLGMAFVAAGICGTGADFVIRAILNQMASLEVVGLYNSGFMMTMVYAGMVFSAFDTDFYPRLSKVNHNVVESNQLVNRQIEVTMQLLSPMLIAFSIGMPVLLPLLFSDKFMPVLTMIQVATLSMFLRGIKLPVAYLMLGKGDSKAYFWMELYSAVVLVVTVVGGYQLFGLVGTGVGILLTEVIDLFVVNIFTRLRYGYSVSRQVVRSLSRHLPLQLLCLLTALLLADIGYYVAGILLFSVSLSLTIHFFIKQK